MNLGQLGIETEVRPSRVYSLLLWVCMFATGACGITLEYIQATLGSFILGNSHFQWAMVIGLMMFWMGIASAGQKLIKDKHLIIGFIASEMLIAVIGGFSPSITYWAFGSTEHFQLVQYMFISLIGILIGLELPLIMRINEHFSEELSSNVSQVLSADYLGSLAGALIWVFLLLRFFPLTESCFIAAGVNFTIAALAYVYFMYKGLVKRSYLLIVLMASIAASLVYGYMNNREWNLKNEQRLYEDPIVFSKATTFQHLVFTYNESHDSYSLFINGHTQFASEDEDRYHEPLVHPVMSLIPDHRRVLILGGGDGLALREILKYPDVEEIILVDLDPEMTEIAANNPIFRKLNNNAFDDARVRRLASDGVFAGMSTPLFQETGEADKDTKLERTEQIATVSVINIDADTFLSNVGGHFNAIFIDLPDASTPELSKLYSRGFYIKIRKHLAENGMMVTQASSPYHAKKSFLCIGKTLRAAGFSALPYHVNVPSFGEWGFYLAWKNTKSSDYVDGRILELAFTIPTRFITGDLFRSMLVFGKGELDETTVRLGPGETEIQVNTMIRPWLFEYYHRDAWHSY